MKEEQRQQYLHFGGTSYNCESDFYEAILDWDTSELSLKELKSLIENDTMTSATYKDFLEQHEQYREEYLFNPQFTLGIYRSTIKDLIEKREADTYRPILTWFYRGHDKDDLLYLKQSTDPEVMDQLFNQFMNQIEANHEDVYSSLSEFTYENFELHLEPVLKDMIEEME